MPFPFTCPHCGGITTVADEFAGRRGPCIHCGREVEIPAQKASKRPASTHRGIPPPVMRALNFTLALLFAIVLAAAVWRAALPVWQRAHALAVEKRCAANLKTLGLALKAYEADFGSYPPAVTYDGAGKPLYSWRVLILPYLGDAERGVYSQFDLDSAWNAPRNVQAANQMPEVFCSPSGLNAPQLKETSYLAVVGPGTMFPADGTERSSRITNDPSQVIILIESTDGVIKRAQPGDLDVLATDFLIAAGAKPRIGGNHPDGVLALFADGSVRKIPLSTPPGVLEAMTIIGSEAKQPAKKPPRETTTP